MQPPIPTITYFSNSLCSFLVYTQNPGGTPNAFILKTPEGHRTPAQGANGASMRCVSNTPLPNFFYGDLPGYNSATRQSACQELSAVPAQGMEQRLKANSFTVVLPIQYSKVAYPSQRTFLPRVTLS